MSDRIQTWHLHQGDVLDAYENWATPKLIISDGAYGVGGFHGDPRTPAELVDWYKPHIEAWSQMASPNTTLWFWNTEVGWASVHGLLVANGWKYEFTNIWNKGMGHVAGNVNSKTLRRFPIVTEVCVVYTREPVIEDHTKKSIPMKVWLLQEWKRTGLPVKRANDACGVKDAASRKYFDQGWLWYAPPPEVMEKLVEYANSYGDPDGKPYFSIDGSEPVTKEAWAELKPIWNYQHGVTNVWDEPGVRGKERFKGTMNRSAPRTHLPTTLSSTHLNQKPLKLMRRIVESSSNPGDVVWEPFGGLCTGSVASVQLERIAYAAEFNELFAELAEDRLKNSNELDEFLFDINSL
jgi:hypothetical protein